MIIGGIAAVARGVSRFTSDVDVAVRGDQIQVEELLELLGTQRIVPRFAHAAKFAKEHMVLLVKHQPSSVDLDVTLAWTSFEHEALAAATVAPFGRAKAPMARPEDLIVFKAIAGRGKDLDDMRTLLELYPKLRIARIRARVRELAALADAPSATTDLERVIAAAKKTRATPRAAPRSGRAAPRASPGTARSPRRPRR
jgi:hypothetical protein